MKRKTLAIAVASVAAAALTTLAATGQTAMVAASIVRIADKADNFRLVDQNSKSHELFYYKNQKAIVLVSQANGAKYMADAAPAIEALRSKYAKQDVSFFLLNSSTSDDRTSIAAEMKKIGLDLPVLMDDTQLVGESLGVSRVSEAFVIDPKTWTIVYHGAIDDRFAGKTAKRNAKAGKAYVANALDAMLAGKAVAISSTKLDSPALVFAQRDHSAEFSRISYSKTIAPILSKNCIACHSEGGIGPFAMDSYEKIKGFAPTIREAIRTDRMPPYNADPHVGKFRGDMNLSNADQQTLVHWIEAGAPRGDGEDPLKINAKPAPEWELGEPDLVLTLPSYKIPASGVVNYQNLSIDNPLTEGRWLRATQVKPGDRRAVHHVVSTVGAYAIGAETTTFAEGAGSWVASGQKFTFQMHYTPYGKETTDTTRIGLYFYPKEKPPEIIRRSTIILNMGIEIPPGEAHHEEVSYITFPQNATLYSMLPHAHYRGENMAVSMLEPGAKEEKLILSLPKYDFNWQRTYDFAEPLHIKAGTRIITRHQYDNSKNNPANPDPTITVRFGEQSWQEMQATAVDFRWDDETVADRKDDYQMKLSASLFFGSMDTNIDGKIAKTEIRGPMGQMFGSFFDRLDVNKDGFLDETEMSSITQMMGGRLGRAASVLGVGL